MLKKIVVVVGFAVTCFAVACGPSTPPQSQECKDYVDCCKKQSGSTCVESSFGAMGTCWTTTQAAADSCTTSCKASNDSYKSTGLAADAGCTIK